MEKFFGSTKRLTKEECIERINACPYYVALSNIVTWYRKNPSVATPATDRAMESLDNSRRK
jgi:hypothetical protein